MVQTQVIAHMDKEGNMKPFYFQYEGVRVKIKKSIIIPNNYEKGTIHYECYIDHRKARLVYIKEKLTWYVMKIN